MSAPDLLASGAALVVLGLLVVRTPLGVAALLAFYPFIHEVPRSPVPGLNAQTVLVGVGMLMTLVRTGVRFPPAPVTAPVVAFVLVILMGFCVAEAGFRGFDPDFDTWERIKAVKSRVFTTLVFCMSYWWARDPLERRRILESLSVGLLFCSAFALVGHGLSGSEDRAAGLFGNPNYLGDLLGVFLIVPLYLVRSDRLGPLARSFHAVVYALGFATLLLSLSRGAWLAAFAGHCVWLVYERRQLAVLALVALVLATTLAYPLVPRMVRNRVESTFAQSQRRYHIEGLESFAVESSAGTRLVLYRIGYDVWLASPLWGHGLDTFPYLVATHGARYGMLAGKTSHSLPLKLLVETGLIGIAGFVWTGVVLLWLGRRLARLDVEDFKLGPLLLAVSAGAGVANVFHNDFLLSAISSAYFWAVLGSSAACCYAAEPEPAPESAALAAAALA